MNEFVNRWYERYIHFVARRAWPILIAGLAVTGVTGWISTRLTVDASYLALLPKTFPSVVNLNRFTEQFGGFAFLLPVIETKDLNAGKRFVKDLAARAAKLPEVRFAEYRFPSDFFKDRDLLYLELDDLGEVDRRLREKIKYEKRKANPMYIALDDEAVSLDFSDIKQKYNRSKRESDYYVSPDRQMLVMLIRPAGLSMDVAFARRLVAAVQKEVAALNPSSYAADMRVGFTGRFQKQIDEYDVLINDITRTTAWAGILAWVLLFLYYRTPWILLLMGLPLASGLVWTMAFATLTIGHLSIITGFLIAVLLGLGMDYVVHFYNRYLEETEMSGAGNAEKVLIDMKGQAWAMISAALTTAVAFYPLALAEFKGFHEFGIIAGTGVMLSLLAFLTVFPALIILAERFNLRLGHRPHFLFPRWATRGLDHPVWVMLGCAGITLGALALATRLGFEYDM
ncbi:MAG: MMPL family transporter, partial [bacterium]